MPLSLDQLQTIEGQRDKALADAQAVNEEATDLNEAQETRYRLHLGDYERHQKKLKRERRLADEQRAKDSEGSHDFGDKGQDKGQERAKEPSVQVRDAYEEWLCAPDSDEARERAKEFKEARARVAENIRSHIVSADEAGGLLTLPPLLNKELLKEVEEDLQFRNKVDRLPMNKHDKYEQPREVEGFGDADWGMELTTGSDQSAKFDMIAIILGYLSGRTEISIPLLQDAPFVWRFILRQIRGALARPQDKGILIGDGTGRGNNPNNHAPIGIFCPHPDSIPGGLIDDEDGGRDILMNNGTGQATYESYMDMKLSLRAPYQDKAEWVINNHTFRQLVKIKYPGTTHYIFQEATADLKVRTLLSRPVDVSSYAPGYGKNNQIAADTYQAAYGVWKEYLWLHRDAIAFRKLFEEPYASRNSMGLIYRARCNGRALRPSAWVRGKAPA